MSLIFSHPDRDVGNKDRQQDFQHYDKDQDHVFGFEARCNTSQIRRPSQTNNVLSEISCFAPIYDTKIYSFQLVRAFSGNLTLWLRIIP